MTAAPRLPGGFLAGPRDEAAGEAHRRDAGRRQRIVSHQDGVIDLGVVEFRDGEAGRALAEDAHVDDAGRDVKESRAARFRRRFTVKQVPVAAARADEDLLVVREAELAGRRADAAVEDEPVRARQFLRKPRGVGQHQLQLQRVGGRLPHDRGQRLGLPADVAEHVEVVGLPVVERRVGLEIDDGEKALRLVLDRLVAAHFQRVRKVALHH